MQKIQNQLSHTKIQLDDLQKYKLYNVLVLIHQQLSLTSIISENRLVYSKKGLTCIISYILVSGSFKLI